MRFAKLASIAVAAATASAATIPVGNRLLTIREGTEDKTNGVVTYDARSLMIHGERVLFYSGSVHPFRIPVAGLYLDIFQKIKALGYNGVTFYVDWSLLEGTQGTMRTGGIFDLQPFFDAAQEAGVYLLARPGPYINAEAAGGGFPGWLARNPATLRTSQSGYINATNLYMSTVGAIIAQNQITNGGPIVLVQPENEYSTGPDCCYGSYMQIVENQLLDAGIVVPLISNDAGPYGNFVPGSGVGAVDIYGHDGYPLGFDCANPSYWGSNSLPTNWQQLHVQQSPSTPYSIVEFQGGSFDPWGGVGFTKCAELLGTEFENVFYKNDASFGVEIFNLYMTFGGSNWGNIGHPGGYSSYDYGAAIAEDRSVGRQKYAEAKLIANSLRALPAYLDAVAQDNSNAQGAYTGNNNVFITGVFGNVTKYFVARQTDFTSTGGVTYNLTVPTSQGNVTIPQLGGVLSINGRDSKIHVTDGDLQGINLLYTSAELFTFQQYSDSNRVLVLFGGLGETHEFAVVDGGALTQLEGSPATTQTNGDTTIVNLQIADQRTVVQFSNGLLVYVVNKAEAYNYWVLDSSPSARTPALPIVNMATGYLVRNVTTSGSTISIYGDLNQTSDFEILGASGYNSVNWNGYGCSVNQDPVTGALSGQITFTPPSFSLPDLSTIGWKTIDSLPELQSDYDDSLWPAGSLSYTNNTYRYPLNTPTSLYSCDYGFNTGSLLYRGHFVANGSETSFYISPQGGDAFGYSLWLNDTFIGSNPGNANNYYFDDTYNLPSLTAGTAYVFTVLIDHMGNHENYDPGIDHMKQPRGVMEYTLHGRDQDDVTWQLTGNLGGEDYVDLVRGPLNEGAMWFERQGYHQPGPPDGDWADSNGPTDGLSQAGLAFYTTSFDLDMPYDYDIPLSLDFGDDTIGNYGNWRSLVFVNGYQFGKFVSNIGPQTKYPVPQGIWNYNGSNTVAVSLWALDAGGAKPPQFNLSIDTIIQSGYGPVELTPAPAWTQRPGAY